ncbi:SGNH/GDSL hydrolase family protein [Aestuariirhabdus sp. Z084]|uniref:SGNH/GDSL hydrolase family protein n=1 Tax=Aestuariirhabdus haliotis TaxID=2918751 RepID=UPI00201B392A|nr:SGNH/GDSL hydrolase family protein [Aestuariirhabdus haliotis]MCL6415869.1 SGNH/GDSL hydrolase family protein [Aestuariirhabdus haliotis]MCL6419829.1 SGNH/GDSL hydrolase family protein [Aestuariirhabdus haliotis]
MSVKWYRLGWYIGLLLSPVLILQGLWIRHRTERLPDAEGAPEGCEGESEHPVLRLHLLGESPVAGVGVESRRQGLACQTARALIGELDAQVHWSEMGETGSNARQWAQRVAGDKVLHACKFDAVVVVLGVNDTKGLVSLRRWRLQLEALIENLELNADIVVFSAVPEMGRFTALAPPLKWWLGCRARMLDDELMRVVEHQNNQIAGMHISRLNPGLELTPEMLARDGFHPSQEGYSHWGGALAKHIASLMVQPREGLRQHAR